MAKAAAFHDGTPHNQNWPRMSFITHFVRSTKENKSSGQKRKNDKGLELKFEDSK